MNEQWLSINFWRKIFLVLLLDGILFAPYLTETAHSAVDVGNPFEEQLLKYVEGRLSARIKLEKLAGRTVLGLWPKKTNVFITGSVANRYRNIVNAYITLFSHVTGITFKYDSNADIIFILENDIKFKFNKGQLSFSDLPPALQKEVDEYVSTIDVCNVISIEDSYGGLVHFIIFVDERLGTAGAIDTCIYHSILASLGFGTTPAADMRRYIRNPVYDTFGLYLLYSLEEKELFLDGDILGAMFKRIRLPVESR